MYYTMTHVDHMHLGMHTHTWVHMPYQAAHTTHQVEVQ